MAPKERPLRPAIEAANRLSHLLAVRPGMTEAQSRRAAWLDRLKSQITYGEQGRLRDGGGSSSGAASVSMHGFRATSTSGLVNAVQNWIAQVRAKASAQNPGSLT